MIRVLALAALGALSLPTHAAVLSFEGTSVTGASRALGSDPANAHGPSLLNYAGYQWTGMMVAQPAVSIGKPQRITGVEPDGDGGFDFTTTPVDAGFHRSVVSGNTIAYTQSFNGASSLFAGIKALAGEPHFDFNSVWLTSGWRDNIDVSVSGWRDGVSVYSLALVIGDDGPVQVDLDFIDIDEIRFTTSGGTFLYPNGRTVGAFVNPNSVFSTPTLAFDDMDISTTVAAVPEPASLALAMLGLLSLGLGLRQRPPSPTSANGAQ